MYIKHKNEINKIINNIYSMEKIEKEKGKKYFENNFNLKINNIIKQCKKIINNKKRKSKEKNYIIKNNINTKINIKEPKNEIIRNKEEKNNEKNKIIYFNGLAGSGKSFLIYIFANILIKKRNKKICIISDKREPEIYFKLFEKKHNIIIEENDFYKIKKFKNKYDYLFIKYPNNLNLNILNKIKNKYDYIFIDNIKIIENNLINFFNEIIYIIEPNLVKIILSKKFLDNYVFKNNINKNKIKIIINKNDKYSVDEKIIENIFYEYKIINKINYKNQYSILLNEDNNICYKKTIKYFEKIFI